MRFGIPHIVVRLAIVVGVPAVLAACQPSWSGGNVPVQRGYAQVRCGGGVTVQSGDTVFGIARRCNVSVREVIEANRLAPPYIVHPGQLLRMPGGGGEHVVRRGDTMSVLARRYGVDFQTLARTNGKTSPYPIYVGERLRIPGSFGGGTQVAREPSRQTGSLVISSPGTVDGRVERAREQMDQPMQQSEPRHAAFRPQQSLPPEPPPLAGRGFAWPLKGEVVAAFGPLAKGQHNDGINIAAAKGTPISAAENGVVAYAGNELKGFGNLLLIKHADGWMTAYAHADSLLVSKGESVKRGQRIATVGLSGSVSAPQLHFELRKGTQAVDPLNHLRDSHISQLPRMLDQA